MLRHDPGRIGITLDDQGWVGVETLITACRTKGKSAVRRIDRDLLAIVVRDNDKQRFELDLVNDRIRARQGHSVEDVKIDFEERDPPEFLYHGTIAMNLASIFATGLRPGSRHHVHLSPDIETAQRVGARRGKPVILRVAAETMAKAGHMFWISGNGVWLADQVPPEFLENMK